MTVFSSGDAVSAVVADIGSYATKIGFAGEDYPRAYFRSNVAVKREEEKTTTTSDDNQQQQQQQPRRNRRRPIEKVHYDSLYRTINPEDDNGWEVSNPVDKVSGLWYDSYNSNSNASKRSSSNGADWADLIPKFLQHGYESSLGIKELSAAPLLMVERSYNPPPLRQQMLEILMEECCVPATFFGRDATLACYANARTTSTVIDVGYSGTTVTPVFEGYVEQKGIRRSPIGSLAMDELALEHLKSICSMHSRGPLKPLYQVRKPSTRQRSDPFHRLSILTIAQDCRECGAGQSINTAASKSLQVPSIAFTLPDGQTVDVPSHNRFAVADYIVGQSTPEDDKDPASATITNPRELALATAKSDWNSIISDASREDDDDDDDSDMDDAEAEKAKKEAAKYTEATAVGVASRRTTRRSEEAKQQAKSAAIEAANAKSNSKKKVKFNNRVLQNACASYFTANLDHLTSSPIAGMVCDAAFRCDRDQQASVLGNAVLCGGGACIGPTDQAVPDLLREQIEAIIHTHTPGWRVKVLSPAMQERSICSWLGGSILGSLGTFHEMWITKSDYEEWGSSIVNRKCP